MDSVITDPPYSARTHGGQRHGRRKGHNKDWASARGIQYTHLEPKDVRAFVDRFAPICRGWFCVLTDHALIRWWERAFHRHGRYVFAPVPCVMVGMNVRLAGDGPSSWSVHLVSSRPKSYRNWGTLRGAYVGNPFDPGQNSAKATRRTNVVGSKPEWLMRAIVRDYSRPGDLVCDPFSGGGTTLVAAEAEKRRAIGSEVNQKTFEFAQNRLKNGVTPTLFPV